MVLSYFKGFVGKLAKGTSGSYFKKITLLISNPYSQSSDFSSFSLNFLVI